MPLFSLIALSALAIQTPIATAPQQTLPEITRDTYGVPHIAAADWDRAFFDAGYAVAQDRLWQMENSRRLARGQMAEIYGTHFVQSDQEVLKFGYTDAELKGQFDNLSQQAQAALTNYAKGVNQYIQDATAKGSLPNGYVNNGFTPRPWSAEDSVAIAIRLFQLFGRGGAGQLRNMAVVSYLSSQPKAKDQLLDIFDDLAWQNDPSSIPTLPPSEDPQRSDPPLRPNFTRKDTENQLAALPKLGLMELLPVIQLTEREVSKTVAESVHVPFKTGSYCAVVGSAKSAIGAPLLMSGPQMGFSEPSIVHEMSIDTPQFRVAGIDVPGVPGVVIGITPNLAWGLTSGVASTEDIFAFKGEGDNAYHFGNEVKQTELIHFPLKVKGSDDQTVDQVRTIFGPTILHAHGFFFVQRSAYRGQEMKSYDALLSLYSAKTADDVEKGLSAATMSFNFFYAMTSGDYGWMYLGKMPVRASGVDPRFPTIAKPNTDWKGFLTPGQMPHIRNPRQGFLANWNNKPAIWWPNYDTPVWGRIFRNEVLLDQLNKPRLQTEDLESAAFNLARLDETAKYFMPYAASVHAVPGQKHGEVAEKYLKSFDGRLSQNSIAADMYLFWLQDLRTQLFQATTGNFVVPRIFVMAVQPSVILKALQRKTTVNYLGKRTPQEVAQAAFIDAVKDIAHLHGNDPAKWGLPVGSIAVAGQAPIPYSNRGSYIQIVDLLGQPHGENVLPPGESETGEHRTDQTTLAKSWTYKLFELWTP